MTFDQAMKELKKYGTAQNIKIYKRHGAGDNLFGVSFANLRKLQKQIKSNNQLAKKLWKTGNADARSLALLIASPEEMTFRQAEDWVNDINYYLLADLLAALIARTAIAEELMINWMKSKKEYIRQCGYAILAIISNSNEKLSDDDYRRFIKTIEREIHASPNRARHAMNMGLIAIGIYRESLRAEAIAAAGRIGKVDVDHGETSCKTPDAIAYIEKAAKRKKVQRKQ
jgi:3-methyladenine DNA glycosylase AlkD